MQELNHKLATMVTSRENLERLSYTMRDEINDLANKIDNQSLEVKDVQGALRVQNKMFEAQNAKLVGYFSNVKKGILFINVVDVNLLSNSLME